MKNYTEKDIVRFYGKVAIVGPNECHEWAGCETQARLWRVSHRQLAGEYGVNHRQIGHITQRKQWAHV